jgi:hypothetical protein
MYGDNINSPESILQHHEWVIFLLSGSVIVVSILMGLPTDII